MTTFYSNQSTKKIFIDDSICLIRGWIAIQKIGMMFEKNSNGSLFSLLFKFIYEKSGKVNQRKFKKKIWKFENHNDFNSSTYNSQYLEKLTSEP